jgi:tRNA A37 methylthiotransferase MiaB
MRFAAVHKAIANLMVYQDTCMIGRQGTDGSRQSAMNVQLSLEETYADVVPLRPEGASSAFLSIMRGCNNMCAFCIVPFTRGRERSRPAASIIDEVRLPGCKAQHAQHAEVASVLATVWLQRSHGVHTPRAKKPKLSFDIS